MNKALVLAALLASASNLAVAAEDFGFYGYGSLGVARVKVDQAAGDAVVRALLPPGGTFVSSSTTDDPAAFKLQLGYQFDSTWALEGGYTHVNKLSYDASVRGVSPSYASASDKISIWNASAAVTIPFGATGWQGTGRLGVARVQEDMDWSGGLVASGKDSKTSVTFGLGAKYNFNKNVSVRADFDRYKASDDDFNVWSVGAGYKF